MVSKWWFSRSVRIDNFSITATCICVNFGVQFVVQVFNIHTLKSLYCAEPQQFAVYGSNNFYTAHTLHRAFCTITSRSRAGLIVVVHQTSWNKIHFHRDASQYLVDNVIINNIKHSSRECLKCLAVKMTNTFHLRAVWIGGFVCGLSDNKKKARGLCARLFII